MAEHTVAPNCCCVFGLAAAPPKPPAAPNRGVVDPNPVAWGWGVKVGGCCGAAGAPKPVAAAPKAGAAMPGEPNAAGLVNILSSHPAGDPEKKL